MAMMSATIGLLMTLIVGLSTSFGCTNYVDNPEVVALYTLKQSVTDPNNFLRDWDRYNVDPCIWSHIDCNEDNHVIRVDLSYKNFTGRIVPELGNLAKLQNLELAMNNFQGSIPVELGKLTNLISLDLYENNLSGTLPSSLGNLKSLKFLRLNDNKLLSGQVPEALLQIPVLKISNTNITLPPHAI